MATTRSSSKRSSKKQQMKRHEGFIWFSTPNIPTKTDPYELGHGATKNVYLSEYNSNTGFEISKIQDDPNKGLDYNKYAIAQIEPKHKGKTFTDDAMDNIHDELELQIEFAKDGKATKVLGLLLEFPDNTRVVAYTQEDILHQLTLTPNPRICYILMDRCGYTKSGSTMSIWDVSKKPQDVVQQVIRCIDHIVIDKKLIFYDFKEPNLCVSPENEIIALDFDRYFCKNLTDIKTLPPYSVDDNEPNAAGYMFLLFTCEYYKSIRNPDPEIISALYEGIKMYQIDSNLEEICRFSKEGRSTLEHYLIPKNETRPPSFVQYVRTNYLEPMEKIATARLTKSTGTKSTGRKSSGRTKGGKGAKTKKRY
jgi:hypothetical protein